MSGPLTAPGSVSSKEVVDLARSWLGTPYLHQASAKGAGTDCLGLIRGVYRDLFGAEPAAPPPYDLHWNERFAAKEPLLSAARQHLSEKPVTEKLSPGDVLMFRIVRTGPVRHCGIVSAPDQFIHAYAGRCVIESWLNRWWIERLAGVFCFDRPQEEFAEGE
ncbi:MAG: NlpC/P60 family protein [Pseudomonadota bacterium]